MPEIERRVKINSTDGWMVGRCDVVRCSMYVSK